METHIPILVRKLDTLKLSPLNEPLIESCESCGSKLFYVVTNKGLIFNSYVNTGDNIADWGAYDISRAFTQHVCAQCGTSGDSIGHWEHSIIELNDRFDVEDYENALEYLRTGKIHDRLLAETVLKTVEDIKQQVAAYWTRHNIADAVKRVKQEQAKKSTVKEVRDEKAQA